MNQKLSSILKKFNSIAEELKQVSSGMLIDIGDPSQIVERANGTPKVLVVGEFNTGKSSLINSALGENLLPVGVTPTTSITTTLSHGPFKVTIKPMGLKDNIRIEPGKKESAAYGIPGGDFDWRSFSELLTNPENIEKFEQVFISTPLVPEGMVIVDTPGINDIARSRAEVVYGMIPSADIVIFVISATKPFSESEKTFLEEKLLAGDLKKMVFVVNRIDEIPEDERESLLEEISEGITASVNNAYKRIHNLVGEKIYPEVAKVKLFPTCGNEPAPFKGEASSKSIGFAAGKDTVSELTKANKEMWTQVMNISHGEREEEVTNMLHHFLRRSCARIGKAIADSESGSISDKGVMLKRIEEGGNRLESLRKLLLKSEKRISLTEATLKENFRSQIDQMMNEIMSVFRLQRDPEKLNKKLRDLYEYIVTKMKTDLDKLYSDLDQDFDTVIDDKKFLEKHEFKVEFDFSNLPYKVINSFNLAYITAIFFGINLGLMVGGAYLASELISNKRSLKQFFMTATVSEETVLQIKKDLIARIDIEVEYAVDFVRQSIVQRIDLIQSDLKVGIFRLNQPLKFDPAKLGSDLDKVRTRVNSFLVDE